MAGICVACETACVEEFIGVDFQETGDGIMFGDNPGLMISVCPKCKEASIWCCMDNDPIYFELVNGRRFERLFHGKVIDDAEA